MSLWRREASCGRPAWRLSFNLPDDMGMCQVDDMKYMRIVNFHHNGDMAFSEVLGTSASPVTATAMLLA